VNSAKLYLLLCQHCGWKKITDGSDLENMTEVQSCESCGGSKKYKCNQCGYVIQVAKAHIDTKTDYMKKKDKEQSNNDDLDDPENGIINIF